ncbi:hypothetical protein ACFSHT_19655 [Paraburkholderia silviterrae]|uniref:Glycosyltransferase RgtA/B/C/D-like domain-containing protein n=1 Tax=Paraburkholderia silviterrae TaxID=2528715 RepID=A0A4R5LYH0_9BURK|nr:hypothetical protein [Paraburkholderia silviterrae]TDG17402.1 hypothetical protein EYW47_37800 [Paraburkholderia silviterrae]
MYALISYWLRQASRAAIRFMIVISIAGSLLRHAGIPGGAAASVGVGLVQAFAVGLFAVCLVNRLLIVMRAAKAAPTLRASTAWAAIAVWVAVVLLFVLWFSMTRYVWYWDYAHYAHLIAGLSETASNAGFRGFISQIKSTLDAEYNLVPAIAPSLVEYFIGSAERPILIFAIALVYVGPMLLFMAWLVHRASGRKLNGGASLLIAVLATLLFPLTFFSPLYGMPDIGGVILVIAVACTLYRGGEREKSEHDRLATLVLCAGTVFMLCLFRRWYLFIVPPLIVALAAREWCFWRVAPEGRKHAFWRAAMVFAAFLTLCFLSFYWQRLAVMIKGDYAGAYQAYGASTSVVIAMAVHYLGYLPLAIFLIAVLMLAIDPRTRMTAAGVVLCIGSTLYLFTRVQAMGPHHYLLIVPVMTFSVAYAVASLYTNRPAVGKVSICVLGLLAMTSIIGVMHPNSRGKLIAWSVFPTVDMRPPRRGDLPELNRLDRALGEEAKKGRTFCVVSSGAVLNGSTIAESAISFGETARYPIAQKQLWLGDVDRRDGPAINFLSCDVAVVGNKDFTHLSPGEQQVIVYLANAVNSGQGIGASFQETGQTYDLDGGVQARLFRRIAPIQVGDWRQYVKAVNHR